MKERSDREAKINKFREFIAQAMSDVEDLTADNIDAFEIPSFEGREVSSSSRLGLHAFSMFGKILGQASPLGKPSFTDD